MKKVKLTLIEKKDWENFEHKLIFWFSRHPKKCRNNTCTYINQCQYPENLCHILIANASINTFQRLTDILPKIENRKFPSAETIKKWYKFCLNLKTNRFVEKKKTDEFIILMEFLDNFYIDPNKDDKTLNKLINQLEKLYDNFQLSEGCKMSTNALEEYKVDVDIIRLWALFHNRSMRWVEVRNILSDKLTLPVNENVKTECRLAIFESYLNEFAKRREKEEIAKLYQMKVQYLDAISDKDNNGKYFYLLARYYEEEWWSLPNSDKQASSSMSFATNSINKSISLYENSKSGYTLNHSVPWWLYCHKAILFKIWHHGQFSEISKEYGRIILNEFNEYTLKKSVQVYAVTYYLLLDDLESFKDGLNYLNTKIKEAVQTLSTTSSDICENEVDNFTFHHIDLIYYNYEIKSNIYFQLIQEWLQKKIDR